MDFEAFKHNLAYYSTILLSSKNQQELIQGKRSFQTEIKSIDFYYCKSSSLSLPLIKIGGVIVRVLGLECGRS